jgi:glutathione S-transferase
MTIIRHEKARSERLADAWEREIEAPLMSRSLHMVHITLGCALGLEARIPEFRWRAAHPRLEAWYASISERPSFRTTAPKP